MTDVLRAPQCLNAANPCLYITQYLIIFAPHYAEAVQRHAPHPVPPEIRLDLAMWGAPILVITFFWFGCVHPRAHSSPSISWTNIYARTPQMDVIPICVILGTNDVGCVHGPVSHLDICTLRIFLSRGLGSHLPVAHLQLALFNYIIGEGPSMRSR